MILKLGSAARDYPEGFPRRLSVSVNLPLNVMVVGISVRLRDHLIALSHGYCGSIKPFPLAR